MKKREVLITDIFIVQNFRVIPFIEECKFEVKNLQTDESLGFIFYNDFENIENSFEIQSENIDILKTEKDLLHFLDVVNRHGGKFALSNNLKYDNPFLNKWKDKYHIHYLNADYSNCNYHKIDRSKDIEVLITNY